MIPAVWQVTSPALYLVAPRFSSPCCPSKKFPHFTPHPPFTSKHSYFWHLSSEHQTNSHCIQALTRTNYLTWSEEMKALFCSRGLWRLVDGKETCLTTAGPDQTAWDIKQDRAAGELMLNIVPDQRIHIWVDQDDPTKAWSAPKKVFVQ